MKDFFIKNYILFIFGGLFLLGLISYFSLDFDKNNNDYEVIYVDNLQSIETNLDQLI